MIISLTTDFGLVDTYVGQMKAVIATIAPFTTIIDMTHCVSPQNVLAGAYCMETILDSFGSGGIHVGVVDPGVGTDRAAVAVKTNDGIFIGPDNGLFSVVLERTVFHKAVRLTNDKYHRSDVSATFHGRDIFAPVAAHMAAGVAFEDFGEPTTELVTLQLPEPMDGDAGGLLLHVIMVDHYGNLITDLTRSRFDQWLESTGVTAKNVQLSSGKYKIRGIGDTFGDVSNGEPVAYFGSRRRLEIAVRNRSAACELNKAAGALIRLSAK